MEPTPITLAEVERLARRLAPEERAQLAAALLESLRVATARIEAAWDREIEERAAAYDRGELPTLPTEEVFGDV